MVVSPGEALQKYEGDEKQRDDEMDSVHESKSECSITESYFLRCLLLGEQTGQPLSLKDDKGDAHEQRQQHSTTKQTLPFAANVVAGSLQRRASQNQK